MIFASCFLGAALVAASPTNAPAAFSTETERTFSIPDITERNVWLDCGVCFSVTSSNRIEIALGPDVNGDGQLGDDEVPFAFAIDCGRLIVRDGNGNQLYSAAISDEGIRFSLVPARRGDVDVWKIGNADTVSVAQGEFAEGTPSVTTWNLARVRMGGPDAVTAIVSLQRNRFATVFIVR